MFDDELGLVDCKGCGRELLGERARLKLRGLTWGERCETARVLYKGKAFIQKRVRMGEWSPPFCKECIEVGRHEIVREQCYQRFPSARTG